MIKTDNVKHNFVPCGFLKNGQLRPIYGNSFLGQIKRHHRKRGTRPKLVVCVTMYNEDIYEFKQTMRGVMQNYEAMCQDQQVRMKKNDIIVVFLCDGFAKIP